MRPELVFNDLSVREAPSQEIAAQWLTSTMQTVADLIDEGVCTPVIHAERNLYELDLIPDEYGFQEWVEDGTTDHDLRILAWQLTTMSPVSKGFYERAEDTEGFSRSEFYLEQERCDALGIALSWDGIALSLPSAEIWESTQIPISQHLYDEALSDYVLIRHRVRHAALPEHVDVVVDLWRHSATKKINAVGDLLRHWSLLFPRLDLCVEREDKTLPALAQKDTFDSVMVRLYLLDRACDRWARDGIGVPEYGFNARPESRETMANKRLARQRRATCPRRGEAEFVLHCDVQPGGFRMYWLENSEDQRCCIGYIGPHLETVRHKGK
jgi:hypothetical protein